MIRVPYRSLKMRYRFGVCVNRRGLRRGDRREAQYLLGVARPVRVMCEASGGNTGPLRKQGEYLRVQILLARLRERVSERALGQFVPNRERPVVVAHHADRQATLDARFIRSASILQQPALGPARDDTDELGDFACSPGA